MDKKPKFRQIYLFCRITVSVLMGHMSKFGIFMVQLQLGGCSCNEEDVQSDAALIVEGSGIIIPPLHNGNVHEQYNKHRK